MSIDDAIERVIRSIPAGMAFDSHFVIEELIETDSDEYIRFVSQYASGQQPTLTAHQQLGHRIDAFTTTLIQRLPQQSYSKNIHGRGGSECALWRRN